MVQNKEFRLLRRIDIYIGQKLLSQLEGGNSTNKLDRETIEAAIQQGLQENLPSGQALVEPAQIYAKQAATEMAQVFNSQVNTVDRLIQKTEEDTQEFYSLVKQQQQESQKILNNLVETIATNNSQLIKEMQQGNTNIAQSFTIQVEQINQQLRQAALALEKQISNLELHAAQISDITKLQNTLTHNLDSLEKTGQLSQTLMELHKRVEQLQPVLNKLQRPRRIMVVDMEENESA